MYLIKTPGLLHAVTKGLVWNIDSADSVFLTFDDGPHPEITHQVLDVLEKYDARATFFCVGDNVHKFPETYQRILKEGHSVGNHTYHHVSGFTTRTAQYIENIEACARLVQSDLFRPPYGRIRRNQYHALKTNYRIIMWDVLSADFDQNISPQKCLENVVSTAKPGSIIVFHDSEKAADRMLYALPRVLDWLHTQGLKTAAL